MKKHLLLLGLTAVTLGYTNAQTMGNTDTKSTQDSIEKPMEEAGLYDVWIGTASDNLPLHKVVKVVK
jgi:hypothetical protein